MIAATRVQQFLSARMRGMDLRGKLSTVLVTGALIVGAAIAAISYWATSYHLSTHVRQLLQAHAVMERREVELRLKTVVAQAESIANNTVTANALADSAGREIYLAPLLGNQKLAVEETAIAVADYRGHVVAENQYSVADTALARVFAQMMKDERATAELTQMPGETSQAILMVLPIRYRLTQNVEGGVIVRIPLAGVHETGVAGSASTNTFGITRADGQVVAGTAPERSDFMRAERLDVPPPLSALGLSVIVARDRAEAMRDLNLLLVALVAFGLFVIFALAVLARGIATFISNSLLETVAAAEEIAAAGRPVANLPTPAGDEFGRLAAAFNTMVLRLQESYADLEHRVAERTRDLETSQQQAQKAESLLREAVSSIAQGFTIYDENDRLVLCNEAYLNFYETSRDLIVPGATFEQIVRRGAERGQYDDAKGDIDQWVRQRVAQHQNANGEVIEQRLSDGRWLLIVEFRTPSGYIVGNRIDITELKRTTEELRVRELYLRATLDNLPFLFWLKDAESRFLAVNKVFAEACGRNNPDDVVGLTDLDVWPKELAERYRADDAEVMTSRTEKSLEEPVAGGSEAGWIETYKKPVVSGDGTLLGTVGFARDITERVRMAQALAESEQRWELAVRGANDGIWDWNPNTGRVHFSDRWKSMIGYAPEEIGDNIGEWTSRIHSDDYDYTMAETARHLRGESEFYQAEYRLRCKDGSYLWILDRGKALFDADGQPVRMAGSHTDITQRREAEARIRERTEQLNAIFALSPDGFVSFDRAYRVRYANPAFLQMSGLTEKDLLGINEGEFVALVAGQCLEQARFPDFATLRQWVEAAEGDAARGKDGKRRRILIELVRPGKRVLEVGLKHSKSDTVSQILYFQDVTYQSEVDQMKSEFLSTAAHELRTPMASIYGFSEIMLAYEFSPAEQREYLTAIHNQSELMASIVNELLDLARIEARRGKDFRYERLDAAALVAEILANFKAPGGRVAPVQVAAPAGCLLRGDRKKLTQAINNVVSNAYKYSPGGGDVEIAVVEQAVSGGRAARVGVQVSDHGIGMTPAQLERVCERFYRADTSGKIPGTGLGMSIVKEILELHGGEVVISSVYGRGTRVTLWLPQILDVQPLPLEANAVREPTEMTGSPT